MALAAICCPWPQPQPWPQTATAVAPADSHSHARQTATRLVKSSERRALDDDHGVVDDRRALERAGGDDNDVGDVVGCGCGCGLRREGSVPSGVPLGGSVVALQWLSYAE